MHDQSGDLEAFSDSSYGNRLVGFHIIGGQRCRDHCGRLRAYRRSAADHSERHATALASIELATDRWSETVRFNVVPLW